MTSFDKKLFSQLLNKAKGDRSINQFAMYCGVSSAHISRLLRGLLEGPPTAETIKKISDKAYNNVTYLDLMQAAGYFPATQELALDKLQDKAMESRAAYETLLKVISLPIIKAIPPSGEPILTIDNIQENLVLPRQLAARADFAFNVQGDDMADMGIFDGDCILVRQQSSAINGQTVVARVAGKVVIKRMYLVGNKLKLEPAGGQIRALTPESLDIIGTVLGLTRKMD
jgi:SOS-response transcriptional repressor LexA